MIFHASVGLIIQIDRTDDGDFFFSIPHLSAAMHMAQLIGCRQDTLVVLASDKSGII